MNTAWSRRGQAHAEPAGEVARTAGHKRGGFLVTHLDETDGS
jgi:hypothetical protein